MGFWVLTAVHLGLDSLLPPYLYQQENLPSVYSWARVTMGDVSQAFRDAENSYVSPLMCFLAFFQASRNTAFSTDTFPVAAQPNSSLLCSVSITPKKSVFLQVESDVSFQTCMFPDCSHSSSTTWGLTLFFPLMASFLLCSLSTWTQDQKINFIFKASAVPFHIPDLLLPKPKQSFTDSILDFESFCLLVCSVSSASEQTCYLEPKYSATTGQEDDTAPQTKSLLGG